MKGALLAAALLAPPSTGDGPSVGPGRAMEGSSLPLSLPAGSLDAATESGLTRTRLAASIEAAAERLASGAPGPFENSSAAPAEVSSPDASPVYAASYGFAWGAFAYDLGTTHRVIKGGGRELNPVMNRFGDRNMKGIAASALVMESGRAALNHFVVRKKLSRKTAVIMNIIAGGLHIGAGIWNTGQARKQERSR